MAESISMNKLRDLGLQSYQAELLHDMLQSPLPVRKLLVAGPGLGFTFTSSILIGELAKLNPTHHRFLIIGHGDSMTTAQYKSSLERRSSNTKVMLIDRRMIREMEAKDEAGQSIWPEQVAIVISALMLRKQGVLESLSAVNWDLVIVDNMRSFSPARQQYIQTIISCENFHRVLMHNSTRNSDDTGIFDGDVERINWLPETLKDWDGSSLLPNVEIQWVPVYFQRDHPEIEVINALFTQWDRLTLKNKRVLKTALIYSALSSPLGLERQISHWRNRLAHDPAGQYKAWGNISNESSAPGDLESEETVEFESSTEVDASAILQEFNHLLDAVESISKDCKREALESLIRNLREENSSQSMCIFCSFAETAGYLQTILQDLGYTVWLLSGTVDGESRLAALDGFSNEGGIIICTDVALKGIELPGVSDFIHYDPPTSTMMLQIRAARSREYRTRHFFLSDKSAEMPDLWSKFELPESLQLALNE